MADERDKTVDQLLTTAKNGDSSSANALFEKYRNYLSLLATTQIHAKLRARASASDIVQETMIRAHRGFEKFRGTTEGEFVSWLKSILARRIQSLVQNHVDAQIRDVRREVSLDTVGKWIDRSSARLETVLVADVPSPATQLDRYERSVRVADALASLSPDHREVLILRSIEGHGFPEIAKRMNRSHGAVRMLWLRGIQALRDQLHGEDDT